MSVTLQVHDSVTDRRFLPPLLARLRATLAAPVRDEIVSGDLSPLRPRFGPMDAEPLLKAYMGNQDWPADRPVARVLIIEDDIRLKPARMNFAASWGGGGSHVQASIVSLARLRTLDGGTDPDPGLTALRAHKLIAKNVARMAGHGHGTRCLFEFPRSVADLDATPENFCEPDLSALVAAGIARPMR